MKELANSTISDVWSIFEQISQIPRGSGNEKQVSDFVLNYGKKLGYESSQDELFNVLIKVPASKGYENYEPVLVQAHLDMFCDKNKDVSHDFLKDPLDLFVEDGYLKARGTTLGADNGIGVAFILAFIARKGLKHPALEAVFTTQEETTMAGAKAFDATQLKGKKLVSLDHIAEHEICIGCAGIVKIEVNGKYKTTTLKNKTFLKIDIKGLAGGHSGNAIHKRKSSFNFTARLLKEISKIAKVNIASENLGLAANSIARESETIIAVDEAKVLSIQKLVKEQERVFLGEVLNDNITIGCEKVDFNGKVLDDDSSERFIDLLTALPNGMQTMVEGLDLPESSLNIGVVKVVEGEINFGITVRSSVKALETYLIDKLSAIMKNFGLNLEIITVSPFFNTDVNCDIVRVCQEQYKKLYGGELGLKKYHAIMELGVFSSKIEGFEGILMSPELLDIHSPKERLNIKSSERTFEYFVKILENCKF